MNHLLTLIAVLGFDLAKLVIKTAVITYVATHVFYAINP